MADDYELVPSDKLIELKHQLDELKRNPVQNQEGHPQLTESVTSLSHSINKLLLIFREATEEMRNDEKEEQLLKKRIEPLLKKMDTIIDNTQTLANAMVDLNEKVDSIKRDLEILKKQPAPRQASAPQPAPMMPTLPPMPSQAPPQQIDAPLPRMQPIPPLPTQQAKPEFKW